MKKIDIINLGCSKNLVDAENLYTQLKSNGVSVRMNPDISDGEITIINTCGFIGDAKEESVDTILEALEKKRLDSQAKVFVMGCLSERYKQELTADIPEVDGYYGVNDIARIVTDLGFGYQQERSLLRMHSTPTHYAYLKIAEGCDRNCAFCAIPMIRGKQISKSREDLVAEAKYLASTGVKELILISQELTRYGIDLYKKPQLVGLLEDLNQVDGIEWIRLHYTYPNLFGDDLISAIADLDKVCHYLDMPFQHFSDKMLTMMKRGHTAAEAFGLIERIRKSIPDLALRTTLLVGHPGEDRGAFRELTHAVETLRFDRLGVFTYSHEEGTHAWAHYKDEIPDEVKQERADQIMLIQQNISGEINEDKVGQVMRVLIDRKEQDYLIGRTQYDSPEIDNEVLIKASNKVKIGSFIEVKMTDATEFDLVGEPV